MNKPAIRLVDTRTLDRQQWLDVRKGGIGSSDAAAAVGLTVETAPGVEAGLERALALPGPAPHVLICGGLHFAGEVLAMSPEVILFDEPFSYLDYPGVREVLRHMIQLHREGHTLIVTTHDVEKVMAHVDRMAILQAGEIKASGTPEQLVGELRRFGVRPPCYALEARERMTWLD